MATCGRCGWENLSGALHCAGCGGGLSTAQAPPRRPAAPARSPTAAPKPAAKAAARPAAKHDTLDLYPKPGAAPAPNPELERDTLTETPTPPPGPLAPPRGRRMDSGKNLPPRSAEGGRSAPAEATDWTGAFGGADPFTTVPAPTSALSVPAAATGGRGVPPGQQPGQLVEADDKTYDFRHVLGGPDPFAALPAGKLPEGEIPRAPGAREAFGGPDPFGQLTAGLLAEAPAAAPETAEAPAPAVAPPPPLEPSAPATLGSISRPLAIRRDSSVYGMAARHAFSKEPVVRKPLNATPYVVLGAVLALATVAAILFFRG